MTRPIALAHTLIRYVRQFATAGGIVILIYGAAEAIHHSGHNPFAASDATPASAQPARDVEAVAGMGAAR